MADSKSEKVLKALFAVLAAALPEAKVLRNDAVPEVIPAGGLVIQRDGDPGEPEFLFSPSTWYFEHRAEVEVFVDLPSAEDRDAAFDGIKQAIAEALAANRTLGGLVDYAVGENPAPLELSGEGLPGVKAGLISVLLPYDTSDPLT